MEPDEPAIRRTRTADGVAIAYTVSGPVGGPAVVLMPGVPFSDMAAEWRIPVQRRGFEALGASVRFIQYDGRGSGRSQRDVEDLSLDAMLGDLDAVIDAERVPRVVLIGFYHSVMLALAWAARHPARTAGLVLFGGSARGWGPMSEPGTQALLSLIDRDWDTFVESAAHAWLGWPDPELGRQTAEWFRTATTPAIAKATMREASAIDVTPRAPLDRLPRAGPASSRGDGDPARAVARPGRVAPRRAPGAAARDVGQPVLRGPGGRGRPDRRVRRRADDGAARGREACRLAAAGGAGDRRRRPAPSQPRELEVLAPIAHGDTNAEIAASLGISVNTVERHVSNVYRKIDARGRADATAWALRRRARVTPRSGARRSRESVIGIGRTPR